MHKRKGFPQVDKQQSLCWTCAKACGGCSWSKYGRFDPVPGWIAEETKIKINGGRYETSYMVYSCPEFVPDAPKK